MKMIAEQRWEITGESEPNYIKIENEDGKTVARVPWGDGDMELAEAVVALPQMVRAMKATVTMLGKHWRYTDDVRPIMNAIRAAQPNWEPDYEFA